jgi:hypothetical protein
VVVTGAATTVVLTYEHRFDDITDMSIADLKAILIKYGLTSERLIRLSPSDLASISGIDEYVAKIIHNAANERISPKLPEMTSVISDSPLMIDLHEYLELHNK